MTAGQTLRLTIQLVYDERVAGLPRMVFIVLASSLLLSLSMVLIFCCSCCQRRWCGPRWRRMRGQQQRHAGHAGRTRRVGSGGAFKLLEQTERTRMTPIVIHSEDPSRSVRLRFRFATG